MTYNSMLRKHRLRNRYFFHLTGCLRAAVYMAILVYSLFHKRQYEEIYFTRLDFRSGLASISQGRQHASVLWPSDLFYPENSMTQHEALIFASPGSQNKNSQVGVYFYFAIRGIYFSHRASSPALNKRNTSTRASNTPNFYSWIKVLVRYSHVDVVSAYYLLNPQHHPRPPSPDIYSCDQSHWIISPSSRMYLLSYSYVGCGAIY